MSTQVQYRRGTGSQNNAFTGALAEITVDTTSGTLRVHDGITAGGSNIATVAYVTAQISALSANSISSGTTSVNIPSSGGNVIITVGGTGIASFTTAGIINGQANGVGNIGNATGYFNTVFAKATSAQYADLAEMYRADTNYVPGTVVEFGGPAEITIASTDHSTRVAGVISTNPSYLMNATLAGNYVVPVALTGRVPCQVVGTIAKGDRLVASGTPGVATLLDPDKYEPACIIGKSLEAYDSETVGTIEVAVGRF
jgi:hypothetical protein